MRSLGNQVLLAYSGTVSTALAIVMLTGAAARDASTFDRIRVHRLEVVEPDGTLRMVLANKASLPPVIIKGKEHPEMGEARPQAGIVRSGRRELCVSAREQQYSESSVSPTIQRRKSKGWVAQMMPKSPSGRSSTTKEQRWSPTWHSARFRRKQSSAAKSRDA